MRLSQCDDCFAQPFSTPQQCFCSPPHVALGLSPLSTNNALYLCFSPLNDTLCLLLLPPNDSLGVLPSLTHNPLGLLASEHSSQFFFALEPCSCSPPIVPLGLYPVFDKESIVVSRVLKRKSVLQAPSSQNKLRSLILQSNL
jgi:hypothetical protein